VGRPDPNAFVRVLSPALRQAASIARALEGRVRNRPKRGEASDVKAALTLADSAAQEALLVPLLEHFPEVTLEAEEDTPSVSRFPAHGEARVVIDPIDGTLRSYLDGRGPYAVMVGLAIEGRYEAALLALPREGIFLEAVRGRGARMSRAGREMRPVRADPDGRRILVSYELPKGVAQRLAERGFEVSYGCGGAIAVAPLIPGVCAGLRIAATQEGVSIRGRIGALVAAEAGALLEREGGAPFPEALAAPARALLVAADDSGLEALRYAFEAAGI
jgi:fructose-1,6-bisphosphatase/inositol monophosphatase family enzyme